MRIDPDAKNFLHKTSAADVLQLRGIDLQRFISRVGKLSDELMDEISAAIAVVVESQ